MRRQYVMAFRAAATAAVSWVTGALPSYLS